MTDSSTQVILYEKETELGNLQKELQEERTWYDTHIPTVPTPKVPSLTLRKLAHKIEGKILSIEETKIFLSEEKREERIQVSY